MSIRVLLVDDQALVRGGLRMIVDAQAGMEVVGEAADGREAIEAFHRLKPDVVVMDIRMPNLDGVEATRRLAGPDSPYHARVLVLTTFDLDEYVYDALRAGASGFLLKDAPPAELVGAIRVVAAGDALLAPSVTRRLIASFVAKAPPRPQAREALEQLTERETEVLKLIARGLSNAQIADELVVGEATVKTHVARLLDKLELANRVQAAILAYESGLLELGPGAGSRQAR
jgi:DNA-binding NarL/FixJ family response regulator